MSDMLNILKIIDSAKKPAKPIKKQITESTSVAINVTGDQPNDVLSVLDRIMGASSMKPVTPDLKLDVPIKPVTPAMMPQKDNVPMVKTLADVGAYADEAAAKYAADVGEEWKNKPEPTVTDSDYMLKDIAGGMNRPKKQFKKEYPGDNPMSVNEEKIAEILMKQYEELKSQVDELDQQSGSILNRYMHSTDPRWKAANPEKHKKDREPGRDLAIRKLGKKNWPIAQSDEENPKVKSVWRPKKGNMPTKHGKSTLDMMSPSQRKDYLDTRENQNLGELSPELLARYAKKAASSSHPNSISNLASRAGYELGQAGDDDYTAGEKHDRKSAQRSGYVSKAIDRLGKR
jgi:hypothetical protein